MLYKFKSRAAGDVIMLGPQGDRLLELLGRAPSRQGIFESDDLPALAARLEAAIAVEAEAQPEQARHEEGADAAEGGPSPVGLRQRLWPMIEMMRRSHAAGEPIVWGV